jgi:hypothetical protein
MLEIARQHPGIFESGGIARQINTFVIFEDLIAIRQMEIVTRHCGPPLGLSE